MNFHEILNNPQKPSKPPVTNVFDSAAINDAKKLLENYQLKALELDLIQIRKQALCAVLEVSNAILDDKLDDELACALFDTLLAPHQFIDVESELDSEDSELFVQLSQLSALNASDALESLGVPSDTIKEIFDAEPAIANDALERAAEYIETNLPQNDDDLKEFFQHFLYGFQEVEDTFDAAEVGKQKVRKTKTGQTLVYHGVKAIRHGQVTVVNKRVGNTFVKVHLSGAQKAALRKAHQKAFTPNAIKSRLKSLKKGHKMGIYHNRL